MKRYYTAIFILFFYILNTQSQSLINNERAKLLILQAEETLHRKNYDSALFLYRQADSLSSSVFTTADFNNMAGAFYMLHQFDKAVIACKKAISLQSDNIDSYFNLGIAYTAMDSNRQAINAYQYVIKLDSLNKMAYFNMGSLYSELKEFQNAIVCYQKMLIIDPKDTKAYVNMAIAFAELGENEKLFEYMRKAAQMGDKEAQEFLSKTKNTW